jgi:predicted lipoprotein with Yx(FWY)xxD motif
MTRLALAGLLALLATPVAAEPSHSLYADLPANAPARIEMTDDGPILVTPAGMTLYAYYGEDTGSEKFAWRCTAQPPRGIRDEQSGLGPIPMLGGKDQKSCIDKFPPFLAPANAVPADGFTIVERPEGDRQWVYRGNPLYTSGKDRKPGDRRGIGVGGLFGGGGGSRFGGFHFAMAPLELPMGMKLLDRDEGLVLATEAGNRPVYTPKRGRLASGSGEFTPMLAPAIASVSGDLSLVDAGAGRKQYAFRGEPLYLPPEDLANFEIDAMDEWKPVVVVKGAGLPPEFGRHVTLQGEVYTTKNGRTLYTYSCMAGGITPGATRIGCDDAGDPAGYLVALCGSPDECSRRWQPVRAPANARPKGRWSVVDITYPMFTDPRGMLYPADAPHIKVWAYRGRPLFTYYRDRDPGDIWGDGVKGLWGSSFNVLKLPGRPELE